MHFFLFVLLLKMCVSRLFRAAFMQVNYDNLTSCSVGVDANKGSRVFTTCTKTMRVEQCEYYQSFCLLLFIIYIT